jgi:histidine triad (HIT) family protein
MSEDFYCEEVLSGRTPVQKVLETDDVLAYHHTRPFYPVHIVTIPKKHISSLITLEYGACRVITNLGKYQDSKHLHFHVVYGQPINGSD